MWPSTRIRRQTRFPKRKHAALSYTQAGSGTPRSQVGSPHEAVGTIQTVVSDRCRQKSRVRSITNDVRVLIVARTMSLHMCKLQYSTSRSRYKNGNKRNYILARIFVILEGRRWWNSIEDGDIEAEKRAKNDPYGWVCSQGFSRTISSHPVSPSDHPCAPDRGTGNAQRRWTDKAADPPGTAPSPRRPSH